MTIFLFLLGTTPLLGGGSDKPILWRAGGYYHSVISEVYWKDVFSERLGREFTYDGAPGGYANIDFMLCRFKAEQKHKYSTKTHGHLEFTRKLQEFLTPKGIYLGYLAEIYTLYDSGKEVSARITTPGGVTLGVLCGTLPAYPYFSLCTGASFVSEDWEIAGEDSSSLGGPPIGVAESVGFWGGIRAGILYQIRGYFAADFSVGVTYLSMRHTKGEPIPITVDQRDSEILQEVKIGLGLVFAMPCFVEKTIW
jgi:hypothetical protein